MPLFIEIAAAALLATLTQGAPRLAPSAPASAATSVSMPAAMRASETATSAPSKVEQVEQVEPVEKEDALQARVEIGPAVLTIYGPKGEIVSVE
jgi:hypothetical protein